MDFDLPIEESTDLPELIEEENECSSASPKTQKKETKENEEDEFKLVKSRKRRKKDPSSQMEMDLPTMNPAKKKKFDGEMRRISVPAHRYTPLKENWMKLFTPIVQHLKLQIRFNLKTRNVEIRSPPEAEDISNLQKAADFVHAFILGFQPDDALALVRLDDLFVDSFEINDVKELKGDHLSRAIGRLAGKDGKTKFTIENITKTRIVLADSKIHILGSYQNTRIARNAICSLILGSAPSKVYGNLRNMASRMSERM